MIPVAPVDGTEGAERAAGDTLGGEPNIRCRGAFLLSTIVTMVLKSLTKLENTFLIHP